MLSLLFSAGCIGDPDLAGAGSDLRWATAEDAFADQAVLDQAVLERDVVEREIWEVAFPGCEDAERAGALLHIADGEPLLGVLVSKSGRALCVDSLSVLTQETREDPTPTPLTPVGGAFLDPTPTPATDD